MCAGIPAGAFDHRFDAALGYVLVESPACRPSRSHRCFRRRSQGGNLLCTLNRHQGLDSLARILWLQRRAIFSG